MINIYEFIKSQKELKKQLQNVKTGKAYRQEQINEDLQPLIQPLQQIKTEISLNKHKSDNQDKQLQIYKEENTSPSLPEIHVITPSDDDSNLGEKQLKPISPKPTPFKKLAFGEIATRYLGYNASKTNLTDNNYGIRSENGSDLWIGNSPITIEINDIIFQNKKYKGTQGLWELLTLKDPLDYYTKKDLENYEEIIINSNSYRTNYEENGKIKSNTGLKYMQYIKPILEKRGLIKSKTPSTSSLGSGLKIKHLNKFFTKTPKELVYWDDPNELIDRLIVLYGEQEAGNNNPEIHNEILNILEELEERGIIYFN